MREHEREGNCGFQRVFIKVVTNMLEKGTRK